MILKFYTYLSIFCAPLWRFFLRRRVRSGKEDARRLPERWGIASRERPEGMLIWMHGASVGESLSALGLIGALQEAFPQMIILMTTGTRASAGILKNRLPPNVIHQMVPCDVPSAIQCFLDFWKPSLALFIESDLWPNLLSLTQQRDIPTILLNGRISDKSFRRWKWVKPLLSPLLTNFKICLVSSNRQAQRLQSLGATTKVTGNLKFTTPPLTYNKKELQKLKGALGKRPVWFAASTHPGEEALIFKAHKKLRKDFPKLLLILAPRHPHRVSEIQQIAEKDHMTVMVYSDEKERGSNPTIISLTLSTCGVFLIDTLGDLGLFYHLSPLVFMGGSFVSVGGHNLVEPAQLNCAILHGPLMEKNQDVADAFAQACAAYVVNGPEELAEKVKFLLEDPQKLNELIKNSNNLVMSHKKVLDETLSIVSCWVQK